MDLASFKDFLSPLETPVIVLAGRRELEAVVAPKLTELAEFLARQIPNAMFRTGNAKGADEAWAVGVCAVDPRRLQYVLPYENHRSAFVHVNAYATEWDACSPAVQEKVIAVTKAASPYSANMIDARARNARLRAKANYLLRDSVMVMGNDAELAPANAGLFFADESDPMLGGTGHTIRVCYSQRVIPVLQHEWLRWLRSTPQPTAP